MGENDLDKKPSFVQVMLATIAAAFGVQSDKNRERDFKHGSPLPYIVAGVVFTALFVLTIIFVVKAALRQMGA